MNTFTIKSSNTRKAFTMIELVFVIVVVGILAAMALPRLNRDLKQEAADHILSQIRYTQHMAINDNKHSYKDSTWQRRFWTIAFSTCDDGKAFYRVGSDTDGSGGGAGKFEKNEAMTDPYNGKPLWSEDNGDCDDPSVSENIKIGKKYGITVDNGVASGSGINGCDAKYIGFDHLGRPHIKFGTSNIPDYSTYMDRTCTFTYTLKNGESFQITILPESGFAFIENQMDS